jgi:LuxR family maltose regulon positive regulatory protein
VEAKGWADERLKALVLQAVALQADGDQDQAVQLLLDALALGEPEGLIRLFVDEGRPMAPLLTAAAAHGLMLDYIGKMLAACEVEKQKYEATVSQVPPAQPLIEALSPREVEVLQLMARGCSNQEIAGQLFLALDTVKWHNRHIFGKLQVQRRTEAVARAHELGLL